MDDRERSHLAASYPLVFSCVVFLFMGWKLHLISTFQSPYLQVWQNVFKSMLGETDCFVEFAGTEFDFVATALLATYLVILIIVMLNLLIVFFRRWCVFLWD